MRNLIWTAFRGSLYTSVLAVAVHATPASAACISSGQVYCDVTKIQAYNGSSPYNYGGPGFVPPGVGDVLEEPGHGFDTDRVMVVLSDKDGTTTLDLRYYTTFNGDDLTARYADIFLGNNPANPNTFGYAISLADETANGGTSSAGFYDVSGAGAYKTSEQVWQSKTNYIYGGTFEGTDGVFRASPVVVTSAAILLGNFTTNIFETTSGDVSFPNLLDVQLSASTNDFYALFGGGLSVFWGTGDCSNDAILAVIPPRHMPEPFTVSLFVTGMCGMGALRRRKKIA